MHRIITTNSGHSCTLLHPSWGGRLYYGFMVHRCMVPRTFSLLSSTFALFYSLSNLWTSLILSTKYICFPSEHPSFAQSSRFYCSPPQSVSHYTVPFLTLGTLISPLPCQAFLTKLLSYALYEPLRSLSFTIFNSSSFSI